MSRNFVENIINGHGTIENFLEYALVCELDEKNNKIFVVASNINEITTTVLFVERLALSSSLVHAARKFERKHVQFA